MPPAKRTAAKKTAKKTAAKKTAPAFSAEERAAMRERAKEARAERAAADRESSTASVVAKIAEMTGTDREVAQRVHDLVTEHAAHLDPRLWYGMPAYARDGKVVLFVQPAAKFGARYATLGFNDGARLDDGAMWATAFAVVEVTDETSRTIADLVTRAAGDPPA